MRIHKKTGRALRLAAVLALVAALLAGCVQEGVVQQATPPQSQEASPTPVQTVPEETQAPTGEAPTGDTSDFLMGTEALSFSILNNLIGEQTAESSLFSPVAVGAAMAAVQKGASTDTYKQIEEFTGFTDESILRANEVYGGLSVKPYVSLALTATLEYNTQFRAALQPGVNAIQVVYGNEEGTKLLNAEAAKVDNAFAELFESTAPVDSLYIVSGVAPSLAFATPFPAIETFDGLFEAPVGLLPTKMMYMEGDMKYYEDSDIQLCALDMADGRTQLRLLSPTDQSRPDFDELLGQYGGSWLLRDDLKEYPVRLTMPQINLSKAIPLKESLLSLGLELPFSKNLADLSGVYTKEGYPLAVDELYALTKLSVNELGINQAGTPPQGEVSVSASEVGADLTLDEPFLIALVDTQTGAPLLLGWINAPM